ncbi:MAG: hypothetical protein CMB80_01010 [Flammeovirgaceae bacterium]|nr:hypothetical protein [Flammeovirgaceae bacterium]
MDNKKVVNFMSNMVVHAFMVLCFICAAYIVWCLLVYVNFEFVYRDKIETMIEQRFEVHDPKSKNTIQIYPQKHHSHD